MAVKQKVVECVDPVTSEARLQILLRTLQDVAARNELHGDKICIQIVMSLGAAQIPNDVQVFKQFIQDIKSVLDILTKECVTSDLMFTTLKALYNEISDPSKQLSPAMSVVLQLIKKESIVDAVKWILNSGYSEESLQQALYTLCIWLSKWTYTDNLGPLILAFMEGLEAEQHYDILHEVTLDTIDLLFPLIILPSSRSSVGPIVLHMLSKAQNTPEVFHKIINKLPHVINLLKKEKSESSLNYLKHLVNICIALMELFPEYPVNDKVKPILQPYYTASNYKGVLSVKSWSDSRTSGYITRSFRGKVGLNNLGNTCYMNSVLQALFMTKKFRNDVLLMSKQVMPLFSNMQDLFALLQYSQKCSLSPNEILHLARPPGFNLGHQHDSSEFLGYLLDMLHEQEKSVSNSSQVAAVADIPTNSTIVQQSFGGKTMTVSCCDKCGTKSEKIDNFRELQLSFPNNAENQSVMTLLHYYLQPEKLCGDNQYHCDKCGGLTDGERITRVIERPPRLILTLKHFGYDPALQQRTKLLQKVKLEEFVQLENTDYVLYAAVVHCGSSVDSGHYYTFAKDGDEWYKFNDCSVIKTTAGQLCDLKPPETAYILFYRRHDCVEPENLPRASLSQRLQMALNKDSSEYEAEKRKRPSRYYNTRQHRNDDPPPPGCGGGGFANTNSNMYVC